MFILGPKRKAQDPRALDTAFKRYMAYLEANRGRLSASLYEVATSEWYYNFDDPRCPHDAALEYAKLSETVRDDDISARKVSISIKLQSWQYGDKITYSFHYSDVHSYRIESSHQFIAQRTWRYDEFRLSDEGANVVHEIEWAGTGNWLIEASDVQFCCDIPPSSQTRQ